MPAKTRRFRGYAAFDAHGNLMWGTFATTEERAQELADRFQPAVTEGQGRPSIHPVRIFASQTQSFSDG